VLPLHAKFNFVVTKFVTDEQPLLCNGSLFKAFHHNTNHASSSTDTEVGRANTLVSGLYVENILQTEMFPKFLAQKVLFLVKTN
jgi:hypothetical protein